MRKRVLVVDDDSTTRAFFKMLPKKIECHVDTAETGEGALNMIREVPYELVFLDLSLPGISGIDVLRALRTANPKVPVYIITGFYDEYFDQLKAVSSEGIAFEVMQKPIDMKAVLTVIKSVLNGPQQF